jgi:anti-anti-sigma regulatory factor
LTKLEFIDSTGIRMLFELAAELKRHQQALRVVVPDGAHLGDILNTVGLKQAAATDHTVGEAVAGLTRGG